MSDHHAIRASVHSPEIQLSSSTSACKRQSMKLVNSSAFTTLLAASTATASPNMTAVSIFDEGSCSDAPLQIVFNPLDDCSNITANAQCSVEAEELGLYASATCTTEPREFSSAAFGGTPYVLVEIFTPYTDCTELEGVAAYRIDSDCHPTLDASTSFRVIWEDETPTMSLFADATCHSFPMFEFALPTSELDANECYGDSMKFFVSAHGDSSVAGGSEDDSVVFDS